MTSVAMTNRILERYEHLLRNDFAAFAHRAYLELYPGKPFDRNWHIEVIAEKLEAVRHGRCPRLIINVPPRSLKSILGSIIFPAYWLGHNPSKEVMCISYGQTLANDLAKECRTLMLSPFYRAIFPTRLSEDNRALENFKTTDGGVRFALSPDGPVTGRGGDLLVIDDLVKGNEAESETQRAATNFAYDRVIESRVNHGDAAIVLIMQRLHAQDFTSFVQKEEHWEIVELPALAITDEVYRIRTPLGRCTVTRSVGEALQPLRFSRDYLLRKQKRNPRVFEAQYQQRPRAAASAIIDREWLAYYDTPPESFEIELQSWDTAGAPGDSNSFNVCTTWRIRNGHFYLIDRFRDRLAYDKLSARAEALAREYKPTIILVEAQNWGAPLVDHLNKRGFNARAIPSTNASKVQRLNEQINKFTERYVHLPRTAFWLEEYAAELTTFPDSEYSDQVDSTSQALAYNWSDSGADNAAAAMYLIAGKRPESFATSRVRPPLGQEISQLVLRDGTVLKPDKDGAFEMPEELALLWLGAGKGWFRVE